MLANLIADVRYCLRGFRLRPGFAVVIVLTLAFGIGVNVAVFSMYSGLLLRPLPVQDPGRLVNFSAPGPKPGGTSCNEAGSCDVVLSYPMFRDLERADGPFAAVAAHRPMKANLGYEGETASARGMLVSGSYFGTLGIAPALGRLLGPSDDRVDGEASAVVLGYDYWVTSLGADPAAIGRTLVVNGKPLEIVGVAPQGFKGTTVAWRYDVFLPITFRWLTAPRSIPNFDSRSNYWVYVFARLKPGVSLAEARAAIAPTYRAILSDVEAPLLTGITEQTREQFRAKTLELTPGARGQNAVRDGMGAPLALLLAATAIVLLIACVNVANLMLARGAARRGEMAIRASLGGAPRRLLGLLSIEALLLATCAALCSLPVALATLRALASFISEDIDIAAVLELNRAAAALSFGIAAVCAMVFGVVPALGLARTDPARSLNASGARATSGLSAGRFRRALTTAQIALSMTLLVLATLFAQSLANVGRKDLGIRTESLVTFTVAPELNGYSPQRSAELFDRTEQELGAQPGVVSVASSMVSLLSFSEYNYDVVVEGYEADPNVRTTAFYNFVGTGFLQTLGIQLLSGRDFSDADREGRPGVAIVNREFARRYRLGDDAVGKRIGLRDGPGDDTLDIEIVGLIADTAYSNAKQPPSPQIIVPRRQARATGFATFYVRTTQSPGDAFRTVRNVVAALDPNLPATGLRTVEQQVEENTSLDRLIATLAAALATGATLLAALGLYGVLSYTIAQRQREIGLRLALGADGRTVRGMVLRQVGWMAGIGMPVGLAAAIVLGLAASSLLFGLQATDVRSLLLSVGVLSCVLLGASYFPARRASRVDPVVALRAE
jgi:putative ABC transport system permease protein